MKHKTIDTCTPKIVNIFILNDHIVRVKLSFDYIVETLRIRMFTIFCLLFCVLLGNGHFRIATLSKSVWIEAYQNMGPERYSYFI